jgi:hypothetical protein
MLFGHQDNTQQPVASTPPEPQIDGNDASVNPLAVDPETGANLPVVSPDSPGPVDAAEEQSVLNQGPSADASDTGSSDASLDTSTEPTSAIPDPSTPFSTVPAAEPAVTPASEPGQTANVLDAPADESADTPVSDALDQPTESPAPAAPVFAPSPSFTASPSPSVTSDLPTATSTNADALLDLKQQAITQLSPLVSHLDQTPEEKFRTTMMLIQSTDNSALLQEAYTSAQAIPDEKVRAQALLDIVNEINYFTQQSNNQ